MDIRKKYADYRIKMCGNPHISVSEDGVGLYLEKDPQQVAYNIITVVKNCSIEIEDKLN